MAVLNEALCGQSECDQMTVKMRWQLAFLERVCFELLKGGVPLGLL